MNKILTPAQIAAYERDGFVSPFRAISAEQAGAGAMRWSSTTAAFDRADPTQLGRRYASSRMKPCVLFRWAAEMSLAH